MPPRPQVTKFICTSCRAASLRPFSTTARRSKIVPDFTPTTQPELDAIFSEYREKLFIPTSLSKSHQRLIYGPSKHHLLTNDPGVSVNISEEEEIRLQPMKLNDRPDNSKSMTKIAKLLGSTDDLETWRNLYPFLEGMKQARRPFGSVWLEKVTRKANKNSRYQMVVECAEQAATTDVRLTDPFLTRELLLGCHDRAVAAGFKGKEYAKALTMARHLAFLMEKEEHCVRKTIPKGHFDMRRSLFVNAVLLELYAGGGDVASSTRTEEIKKALPRVLALSEGPDSDSADLSMPELSRQRQKGVQSEFGIATDKIENLVPLYSALKFAGKMQNSFESSERAILSKRLQQVDRELKTSADRFKELGGKDSAHALERLAAVERIHQ